MRAADALRAAGSRIVALADRPWPVVAVLCVAQLLSAAVLATSVRHNGLVWFQGGDQIYFSTTGWLLGHADLPPTYVGYGWPVVLLPLQLLTGPTFVDALPLLLPLNLLVLGPLLLGAVYALAVRIGGRLFALWTGVLWVAVPYLVIPLFVDRYHERYVEQFLPQALGLTGMADFPSMVACAVAAALLLRAIELDAGWEAALAGLVCGFAIGVKPANALVLAGMGLALVLARRWRVAAAFAVCLGPALLTLAIWKQRGLGTMPLFSLGEAHAAAATLPVAAESWLDRYVPLDWDVLHRNFDGLREYFWSNRLVQFVPFAGSVAIARRSWPAAGLVFGWVLAFVLVKGSSPVASVDTGSFLRLVMPAWPAYLLCVAAVPLLVPGVSRRLRAVPAARPVERRWVLAAAVPLVLVPLALVLVARPLDGPEQAVMQEPAKILTPVDAAIRVTVTPEGEARRITWEAPSYRPGVYYRVYRTSLGGPDTVCASSGAAECRLEMIDLTTTRDRVYVDGSPPPGVTYRIGVGTNNEDDPAKGDVFVISPPVASP